MNRFEIVILRRDVRALLIPSGAQIELKKGTEVTITQALGGAFTVNVYGNLARISGKDGDALGQTVLDPFAGIDVHNTPLIDLVWLQLKTCYDPEIPVNIVDLGLIYDCQILPLGKNEQAINIKMTLTAPGCGMGPTLAEDVKQKLLIIPGVTQAEVEVVLDPPWTREMMSEAAQLQLGLL